MIGLIRIFKKEIELIVTKNYVLDYEEELKALTQLEFSAFKKIEARGKRLIFKWTLRHTSGLSIETLLEVMKTVVTFKNEFGYRKKINIENTIWLLRLSKFWCKDEFR